MRSGYGSESIAGRSQLAAPIISDAVVLSQPHIGTIPSMGLPRMLSSRSRLTKLRGSIAEGRRLDSPVEHDRKLKRQAASLPHPPFRLIRERAQTCLARCQFGPGVADAYYRPWVEHVAGKPLVAHPASLNESVFVVAAKPGCGFIRVSLCTSYTSFAGIAPGRMARRLTYVEPRPVREKQPRVDSFVRMHESD